jgi:NAD-dependent dihydropyrimidine dehydrogenase PreA subunit
VYIDEQECTGCGVCIPYCPVEAISDQGGVAAIDFDACVECTTCLRFADCPADAIHESPETAQWPRIIRREFSDPMTPHSCSTGGRGRGTEEMKTNDVTGRVKRGEVGIGLEFGRPGVGTRLSELEKMMKALAKVGVRFEPRNPTTHLLADPTTGEMKPELRNERVLSAIVEVQTTADKLATMIPLMHEVAGRVDTVISWEIITRLNDDGSVPILGELAKLGLTPRPNAKINMGLGRPLVED